MATNPFMFDVEPTTVKLEQVTDELNEALEMAETAFGKFAVRASVYLPSGVTFTFEGRQFRIVSSEPKMSLFKASRKIRVEAARALPELHAALLEEQKASIVEIENATASVLAFVKNTFK